MLNQEDDFGDFQSAPTDPFKQPIYAQHEVDETETLLISESDPTIQIGVFLGAGLVEPMRLGLDKSTRMLRRAGMLTRRKLPSVRAKEAVERNTKVMGNRYVDRLSVATYGEMRELSDVFTTEHSATPRSPNNVAEEPSGKDGELCVNNVMQPVGSPRPHRFPNIQQKETEEIDKMMEEERTVWDERNAGGEMS